MDKTLQQNLILSSRKRRITAFFIDHFVMTFLIVEAGFLSLGPNFINENSAGIFSVKILFIFLFGFFLYFAKDSIKGMSIGKWVMGIMVRDEKDRNKIPSFGRLFIRNLFIVIWPVEFIALTLSKKKKRLGDELANTIVVKNPFKAEKLPRILALTGIGLVFFVFIFIFAGTAMKNSDAYKISISEIEKNQEILTESGGIKGYGMMPTGNVSIKNNHGTANFEIKVIGYEKDLYINTYLEKEPNGEWKLIQFDK